MYLCRMDVERLKRRNESKIKAKRKKTIQVRHEMKQYRYEKQNLYEDIEEAYKPVIEVQRDVKDTIDN